MTKLADLHIHTHYSDSTLSPQEVVREAVACGLGCIAITDHDTTEGIKPTQVAAENFDLEVVPAIELSSEIHGKDIHLLGYFIDCSSEILIKELEIIQHDRGERIKNMIHKLKEYGVDNIDYEDVKPFNHSGSIGRPHLAMVLKEKGWVSSVAQAFEKYIGEGCPAYVSKFKLSPSEAISLIRKSGGIAVLAHPMVTNRDELIPSFVAAGLQGIEVYYSNCSAVTTSYYEGIAKKHNLLMTGGSDAHGKAKVNTFIGKTSIPYELVDKLKIQTKRMA